MNDPTSLPLSDDRYLTIGGNRLIKIAGLNPPPPDNAMFTSHPWCDRRYVECTSAAFIRYEIYACTHSDHLVRPAG